MVLENASDSSATDSFDASPTSDNDPYADPTSSPPGSSGISTTYQIDISSLPKPIPILGSLSGFTTQRYTQLLGKVLADRSQTINRPLSQEEAEGTAYYLAKNYAIVSYAWPVGLAAGAWRAWDTRAEYKFPFVKPSETFRPDVFPHPRVSIFTGLRAMLAWHMLRLSTYAALSVSISGILFGSYGASVSAVGEMSDKRLKPMVTELQKAGNKGRSGPLPQPRNVPKPSNTQDDDASPTGGMIWDEPVTNNNTGNMQSQESSSPFPPRHRSPVQMQSESQDKPFDAFDDASPTRDQGTAGDTSAPLGSAWERLRRGEKPAPVPSKTNSSQNAWQRQQNETQKEQRQGSISGDSFTFSKSEEERSFAKEEAQKEFDARIERERRGGDFSQGNGDQRRW